MGFFDNVAKAQAQVAAQAPAPAPAPVAAPAPAPVAAPAPAPAPAQAKARRGRPRQEPLPGEVQVGAPGAMGAPMATAASGAPIMLYVDCLVSKGLGPEDPAPVRLAEIMRPLADQAAQGLSVGHWGLAQYGQGASALAGLLEEVIKAGQIGGRIYADSHSREYAAVCDVLEAYAVAIVRAVR